ncbi:hypothetical protein [Clostridium disporicum]|uniref:hypothetical protein n=1 Tax=Clostridium disporicum TaxID=84024 RepID=UPI0034A59D46
MQIKKMFELYNLNKVGLIKENQRLCSCGQYLLEGDKSCPNCKTVIKKAKLLNVGKNSALAKRYDVIIVEQEYKFSYYQLLSRGFELYETEVFYFSINKETSKVAISNSKIFKTIENNEYFIEFLNTYFDGFRDYVYSCLHEFRYDYAISNFSSLNESQLYNFLNVYLNYKALTPYLRGYKVFYYGDKVNLKKHYPNTDFNDLNDVQKTKLNLKLLSTWDIKNEKYIDEIINISETTDEKIQKILGDISEHQACEDTINSFSLIYNKEISLDDFIRIYNNSRDGQFSFIFEYRQLYKKLISKTIDWSTVEKIDKKTMGTLRTKNHLKADLKLNKKQIEDVYDLLDKDPLEALKSLKK